jgi:hypothetical protein
MSSAAPPAGPHGRRHRAAARPAGVRRRSSSRITPFGPLLLRARDRRAPARLAPRAARLLSRPGAWPRRSSTSTRPWRRPRLARREGMSTPTSIDLVERLTEPPPEA